MLLNIHRIVSDNSMAMQEIDLGNLSMHSSELTRQIQKCKH